MNEQNNQPYFYLGLRKTDEQAVKEALGREPEIVQDAIDAIPLLPRDEEGSSKYKNTIQRIRTACKEIGAEVPRKPYTRSKPLPSKECKETQKPVVESCRPQITASEIKVDINENNKLYEICKQLTDLQEEITEYKVRLKIADDKYTELRDELESILYRE